MGDFSGENTVADNINLSRRSSRSSFSRSAVSSVKDGAVKLEKKVGLFGSIALVVGTIIGSGIFVSPKGVASSSGSVALSLLLWGVGGIITMFGSICMVELGTMIPASGGEYTYIRVGLADWLAFIWAWTQCMLIKPSINAIIILTCSEYILVAVYQDGCGAPPLFHKQLLAAVLILLVVAINVWSVRLAASIQIIFTVAKLCALIIIIVGGMVKIAQGNTQHLETGFDNTNDNVGEIIMAFYSAMFAYDGWTNLNAVTEEVIDPERNMPLAMYIGIPLISIMYVLANVSYFSVMSLQDLLAAPIVGTAWAEQVIPQAQWVIPVCVALSTFGSCNGGMFAVGRLFYAAAKQGHMFNFLSYIDVKNVTPLPSLVVSGTFAIIYCLIGEIGIIVDMYSFAIWLFYAITMLAMIVMRYREPYKSMRRPYKAPIGFALIVLIFSLVLVIVPTVLSPQIEFLYAAVVILAGFIFYFPFVYCKVRAPCMKEITKYVQLLCEVAPPPDDLVLAEMENKKID